MSIVHDAWAYIEQAASKQGFALPPAASEAEITAAEEKISLQLPDSYREFLGVHNGTGETWILPYKSGDFKLLSVADTAELWRSNVDTEAQYECNADVNLDDIDPECEHPIQPAFWLSGWIPISENGCGDYFFLDMAPSKFGNKGQVVDWWHEAPLEAEVISDSFAAFFHKFAEGIHTDLFRLRQ